MSRCKTPAYFEDIRRNRGNIMEVYIKDNNGDPRCPINGRIDGLFVTASHEGYDFSPFGSRCLNIPAERMFQSCPNLYFADFYCSIRSRKRIHYVTVVMTKPGSLADFFCRANLVKLDAKDNPFLVYNGLYCCVPTSISVEVLYTENINLQGAEFTDVRSSGTSSPNGFPKDPNCSVCNLHVPRHSLLFPFL